MRHSRLFAAFGALALLITFGCGQQDSDVPAPDPIIEPPEADPAPTADPVSPAGAASADEASADASSVDEGSVDELSGAETHTFTAQLSGTAGPAPGDPAGTGSAQIVIDAGTGEVCYELTVENIAPPTMAHIHTGSSAETGGVAVPLETPTEGRAAGCVMAPPDVAAAIIENPEGYYVNVHNQPFPPGAIRGQLTR